MAKLRLISFSILFFVGLFSIFSLFLYFGDWHRLSIVALLGAFVGLLAAPEIEPKLFKYAWIYQLVSGAFAGATVGYLLGADSEFIAISLIIGGVLGFMAPYWIKHVQIP